MTRKIVCGFLLLLMLCEGFAQKDDMSDVDQLKALNAKFISNFVNNDSASHGRIIHHDFVCITSDGGYINRKDYLEWWAHGFDGYQYWDYRDERISVYGNTALVRAKNKYVVIKEGKEISGMSMYTDTYVKENGTWKCVQAQISKVSPANYSGDETIVKKWDMR